MISIPLVILAAHNINGLCNSLVGGSAASNIGAIIGIVSAVFAIGFGICLPIWICCSLKSRQGGFNAGRRRRWTAGSSTATAVVTLNSVPNRATQGPRAVFNLRTQQTPSSYPTNQYAQTAQPGPSIPTNSSLQEAPPPSYEAANAYSTAVKSLMYVQQQQQQPLSPAPSCPPGSAQPPHAQYPVSPPALAQPVPPQYPSEEPPQYPPEELPHYPTASPPPPQDFEPSAPEIHLTIS